MNYKLYMVTNLESNKMISLGIDQGLANMGYSIIELTYDENFNEIETKVIEFGTKRTKSTTDKNKRLLELFKFIIEKIKEYNFNIISCEKLFFNPKLNGGRNKSASIMDTQMVSGLICLLSAISCSDFKDFVPGTIKKYIAGSGRAKKEDMKIALDDYCSKQNIEPKTEHDFDAIGIALTGGRYLLDKFKEE